MSDPTLREIAPHVHVAESRQGFYGVEVGARMTVLQLGDRLLVHSPIAFDPAKLSHLGTPGWALAPNLLHHLYIGPWAETGYELWCGPGLPEKRFDLAFAGVIDGDQSPFGDDVQVLALACFGFTREVVLLHRPSRTLLVTDLLFNIAPTAPWMTRAVMAAACGYPGPRTTLLERFGMNHAIATREVNTLLTWDFDRIVLAHGDIIERGGKAALRGAFSWLSLR